MSMVKLSFQDQSCDLTLEEGLEEYRAYLQANGKKQLIDKPNSTVIRDHDATHVIFGLDTSIEQESLLDSWVLRGCDWKFKELLAYGQLPELKELNKYLQKEVGLPQADACRLQANPFQEKDMASNKGNE